MLQPGSGNSNVVSGGVDAVQRACDPPADGDGA